MPDFPSLLEMFITPAVYKTSPSMPCGVRTMLPEESMLARNTFPFFYTV